MTWLVFGVSCLLVLAGAISIISGAPIIQLERGWAEVIAGAVALSSGGVVFALAAILVRLESLRDAMQTAQTLQRISVPVEDRSGDQQSVRAFPAEEPPVSASAETVAALVTADAEPAADEDDTNERHGLWKRVRRPDDPRVANPVPLTPVIEPSPLPFNAVPDLIEPAEPPAQLVEPVHEQPPPEPAAQLSEPPLLVEDKPEDKSLSWLDRSLFRSRSKTEAPRSIAVAAPEVAVEPGPIPSVSRDGPNLDASHAPTPSVFHDELPPSSAGNQPDRAGAVAIQDPGPSTDEVQVIGRYQAGVASYVMYSDGTIEVETEGGELHRFESMDELKAYIAAQDTPVT